jgi:hypothetical protein
MTKEIGFMILIVSPEIVLAVSASVAVIVRVATILLHIRDVLAACYARAGDSVSAIIADEYI